MTKPSEIEAFTVIENEAGAVVQLAPPPPTDEEARLAKMLAHTYSGDDILTIEPRAWLVKDWLPLNSFIVVYSPPGVGKSFYGLTLALEAASGGRWCGTKLPKPLTVLYVSAERYQDQRDRAEAWKVATGKPLPSTFHLQAEPLGAELTNPLDVTVLCQAIQHYAANIVVLDTYAAMTAGLNENDTGETNKIMRDAIARLKEATNGGIVIAIHHTNKAGGADLNALRGSGVFGGAVDVGIALTKANGQIAAQIIKSNAGLDLLKEHYTLEPIALPPAKGQSEQRQLAVLTYTGQPVPTGEAYDQVVEAVEAIGRRATCKEITDELNSATGANQKPDTIGKKLAACVQQGRIAKHGATKSATYSAIGTPLEGV